MNEPQSKLYPDEPAAPDKLVEAFRGLPKPELFVPKTVDDSVRRRAREHFETRPTRGFRLPLWLGWSAAVASVLLAGLWRADVFDAPSPSAVVQSRPREDFNQDGRVDILDAFALARRLQAGQGGDLDLNGDGTTDQADVDLIAARAVRLDAGGPS